VLVVAATRSTPLPLMGDTRLWPDRGHPVWSLWSARGAVRGWTRQRRLRCWC